MSPFFPANNGLEILVIGYISKALFLSELPWVNAGTIYGLYNFIGVLGFFALRNTETADWKKPGNWIELAAALVLLIVCLELIQGVVGTVILTAVGLFMMRRDLTSLWKRLVKRLRQ